MQKLLSPAARRSERRGFTLIELLVVMSIIALLIAILLPALSGAKMQANKAACAAKLSGLGLAMANYLAEYDNTFPVNGVLFPKDKAPNTTAFATYTDSNKQHWQPQYGALWNELATSGTTDGLAATHTSPPVQALYIKYFLCPADDKMRTNPSTDTTNNNAALSMDSSGAVQQGPGGPGYWSYSVNAVCNSLGRFRNNFSAATTSLPWTDPLKMSQVVNQDDFILFLEEDDRSLFNDEVFDPPAYNGGDKLSNRHGGQGNVAFADRHVEPFPEIQFDNVPSGAGNANQVALKSPITRKFFPDNGAFGQ